MSTPEGGPPLWDIPVRVAHWLLVLGVPAAWWTAEEGRMTQHAWIGYTVLCLVLTRLTWGFFGSPQARFADFLRGPRAVIAYLRRGASATPGHNPLGGWSVMALWLLVLAQAGSGLFNSDGIFFDGPFYHAVDSATADTLGSFHETSFWVLVGFIALHVAVVAWYQFRGERLLGPMVRGSAPGRHGTGPAAPTRRAVTLLVLVALALWLAVTAAPEPATYW